MFEQQLSPTHGDSSSRISMLESRLREVMEKLERHEEEIFNTTWKDSIANEISKV